MNKNITVISGDGVGPEVTRETLKVLNAIAVKFNHQFNFTDHLMGAVAIDKTGDPLPQETIDSCRSSDAVLLGAIGHPKYDHDPSAKVRPEQGLLRLRKELQLYANIRPVSTFRSLNHLSPLKESHLTGVSFLIYRELTGGIYFGKKELSDDGTEASDLCIYNKSEISRIAHLAFASAQKRKKRLTLIDKANVLETSRLWRKTVREIATAYPDVRVEYLYVDNAAVQIILNPRQFDVILTENMFGDILSHEASVITGSIGLLPSSSIGEVNALFEPIHGSYPQAAGKDIANPVGSILSGGMMMEHFGLIKEARLILDAVEWTLNNGFVTKDIDPVNSYFTSTLGELICNFISNDAPQNFNERNIAMGRTTII